MNPIDLTGKPCPEWFAPETKQAETEEILKGMDEVHAFIVGKSKTYLINHGDVKTWHQKLFSKVVPIPYYAGNYRCSESSKPCLAWDVGTRVPIPPHNFLPAPQYNSVPALMQDYSDELTSNAAKLGTYLAGPASDAEKNREIVKLLTFQVAKFIQIHPFINGNGRISRLLANYICHRYDLPLAFGSPHKRPNLHAYEIAGAAAMQSDYSPLYMFFLTELAVP